MRYLRYLCLFAYSGVQHMLTICVTWWVSYKRQELLTLRGRHGSPTVLVGPLLPTILLFCVAFFCFACLRLISCAPDVTRFS